MASTANDRHGRERSLWRRGHADGTGGARVGPPVLWTDEARRHFHHHRRRTTCVPSHAHIPRQRTPTGDVDADTRPVPSNTLHAYSTSHSLHAITPNLTASCSTCHKCGLSRLSTRACSSVPGYSFPQFDLRAARFRLLSP